MDVSVQDKLHTIFLIILFFILVIFRLAFFSQLDKYPGYVNYLFPDDQEYYHKTAFAISEGNFLGHRGLIQRSPGYVYFTGFLYLLSGNNTKLVLGFQAFLGVLTGLLIYLIGRNVFNKYIGLYAAFFYAFYLPVLCYESALLMCSLITFLMTLGFFLFIMGSLRRSNLLFCLAGLALGWAFVCRPNNLLLAVILVAYLLFRKKEYGLKPVGFYVLGFSVFYVLVIIRNVCAGVNPFSITTQGQLVLLAGHARDAIGTGWLRSQTEQSILSDNIFVYLKKLIIEIGTHFPYWLKIQLIKCYGYFFNYEFPQFIDYYIMREIIPFLNIPFVSFGIICPLALFGAGVIIKKRKEKFSGLLVVYFFGFFISVVIFYVISRFRQPAMPFFCVLAGYALYELKLPVRWRVRLVYLSIIAVLIIVCSWPHMRAKMEKRFYTTGRYNRGILYLRKNMPDEAIADLEYVMEAGAVSGHTAFLLGVLYEQKREFRNALKWFYKAWSLGDEPKQAALFAYLGRCHVSLLEYDKAVGFIQKSLYINSSQLLLELLLAQCYVKLDQMDEAVAVWKSITQKFPDDYRAFYFLGNYYFYNKDYTAAYPYVSRAYKIRKLNTLRDMLDKLKNMKK